ncbi:hypothetical protein BC829DRAFT_386117 [Chytridium lagenaria]|nr:hypothetical protein BC829DRAFT_386117 [Chytridium lagenaria]
MSLQFWFLNNSLSRRLHCYHSVLPLSILMASLKSFAVSLFGPETFRRRSSSLTPNSRLDKQDNRKRLRSRSVSSKPHEATLPSRRPSHSSIHLQNENPLSKHIDTKLGLDHARWSLRVECDDDDSEVRSRPRTSTDETIVSDTSTLAADGATSINLSTYSSSYRRKGGQMIYVYADTLRTLISSTSVRTMSPKVPQYQRTIRDIPFDILLRAFAYLDSKTVLKCERACRDWKRNLVTSVADFTLWQRVVPKTVDACLSVPSSLLLGETFRDMLMLFHRWERLGSLYGFNGSGVGVEVKPVRIVDNLPPAPQVEDSRHIVAALGNGVTLNGTTAFYLSAYPVSLAFDQPAGEFVPSHFRLWIALSQTHFIGHREARNLHLNSTSPSQNNIAALYMHQEVTWLLEHVEALLLGRRGAVSLLLSRDSIVCFYLWIWHERDFVRRRGRNSYILEVRRIVCCSLWEYLHYWLRRQHVFGSGKSVTNLGREGAAVKTRKASRSSICSTIVHGLLRDPWQEGEEVMGFAKILYFAKSGSLSHVQRCISCIRRGLQSKFHPTKSTPHHNQDPLHLRWSRIWFRRPFEPSTLDSGTSPHPPFSHRRFSSQLSQPSPTKDRAWKCGLETSRVWGCKFRIYKRKHDRLNLGNSGFACLKGYPGGMWVVFHDLGEEKCVWMRRPC